MLINVKLLNGVVQQFDVEPTDTILELKQKLEEREGISNDNYLPSIFFFFFSEREKMTGQR